MNPKPLAKRHEVSLHIDAPLIVDVDLSILGSNPDRFREYEAQIRMEYSWVEDELFARKRSEILEAFLERSRIFTTDRFHQRYEQQARANLSESISRLQGLKGNHINQS